MSFQANALRGMRSGIRSSIGISAIRSNLRVNLPFTSCYSTHQAPAETFEQRTTEKSLFSRKTFLMDYYKYLNENNEIVLFVHHNNVAKADNKKVRSDLKKAGAQLNIIRNSIYNVYLKSEKEEDPSAKGMTEKNRGVEHPISPLLNGPTAVITIPKCEPSVVNDVLKVIKNAQEKLILIGARVETSVFDVVDIEQFKTLPNKEQLHSQLAGLLTILGGAGLVRTLETASNVLYLTLEERRKDIDPSEKKEGEDQ
ncbi:mitochondrial 54S ribosomal protein YmL11 [Scheffersomyces xylosifermentans]|uniref:mitochondrial 54S ribosomal protein YmL11 n=1 Tax=Scheffersomyces xylosifermentans TaxID=1304137 RepID=UPI00315C5AC0